jgi:hypothetical protein
MHLLTFVVIRARRFALLRRTFCRRRSLAAGTLITIIILSTKVTRKAVAFDVRLGEDVNDTLFPSFLVFFCYFAVPVE